MTILFIAKTLSLDDGQGRYAQAMIKGLKKYYSLIILSPQLTGFKEKNIEIYQIPDLYSLGGLLRGLSKLISYLYKIWTLSSRVDLVHFLTDCPYYILFSPFIWLRTKSFFITAHGTYGVRHLDGGWKKEFLKRAYQKAKKVICVSNFTKEKILKRVKLDNLVVINNGVDYQKWQIEQEIDKLSEQSILGVGALKFRKGYHISIPAVAAVKEKYPDLKYYIVGNQKDRNYFQKLKDLVRNAHLENNVIFLENLSDQELVKLYHRVNLFLLTPVNINNKFEGFGLVYLEANASGKPVIGTYGCGAEDAIKDGFNGLLVPQNDIEKTTEAILKILEHPDLAQKLSQQGRQRAEQMDWSNIVNQYIQIYQDENTILPR